MVFCSELTCSLGLRGFDYEVQVRERQNDAMLWGLLTLFVPAVKVTHTGHLLLVCTICENKGPTWAFVTSIIPSPNAYSSHLQESPCITSHFSSHCFWKAQFYMVCWLRGGKLVYANTLGLFFSGYMHHKYGCSLFLQAVILWFLLWLYIMPLFIAICKGDIFYPNGLSSMSSPQ